MTDQTVFVATLMLEGDINQQCCFRTLEAAQKWRKEIAMDFYEKTNSPLKDEEIAEYVADFWASQEENGMHCTIAECPLIEA